MKDRSVTIEGLKNFRVTNRRYRNRRIGDFLKELHLTEEEIPVSKRIINAMETNGSQMPEFETDEERTYFISRFFIRDGFNDEDDSILKESLVSNTNQAANQAKSRNKLSPLEN